MSTGRRALRPSCSTSCSRRIRRRARPRWPYLLVVLALVAAGLAAVFVLRGDDGPKGPPHPSTWDPQVQPYVDFVEKERDLKFAHPVYVDFLTEEEFKGQVTADRDDLSKDDLKELEQATGLLRAMGVVEGDVDLFDQLNELQGQGIIGFYSYDDERLRIRGTELTPAVESTLVHELTHALQDQNFDLGARLEKLAKADDTNSSAAESGFDSLVEGDARRIETAWRDSLSPKQRKALDKEQAKAPRASRPAPRTSPRRSRRCSRRRTSSGRRCSRSPSSRAGSARWTTCSARRPPRRSSSWTRGRWSRTTRAT